MSKKILWFLAPALAVVVVMGFFAANTGAQGADAQVDPDMMASLMRQKLQHAQALLAALAMDDYERMGTSAERMKEISIRAQWSQAQAPLYGVFGDEFRSALDRLQYYAVKHNTEGATLTFNQVVVTCVQCHKVIREGQGFAGNDGAGAEDLLGRMLAQQPAE